MVSLYLNGTSVVECVVGKSETMFLFFLGDLLTELEAANYKKGVLLGRNVFRVVFRKDLYLVS